MNCTLKIISGPENGKEFACAGGETFIGRSQRCGVRLSSASISYEQAVITRAGDDYFIENLSANGTLVHGERITAKTRLHLKDQIRMGAETTARVTSLPAAAGGGSSRRMLMILLAIMVVAGLALIIIDPFSGTRAYNWSGAYGVLQEFAQRNSDGRVLPKETSGMLQEAWRHELAGDRSAARPAWVRLHVLLSGSNDKYDVERYAAHYRGALRKLLEPRGELSPTDEELKGALLQFVIQMERRK